MKKYQKLLTCIFLISAVLLLASNASATLVRIDGSDITPLASVITFSEYSLGTVNPTYNFGIIADLDPVNDFIVTFDGYFIGQDDSGGFPNTLTDNSPTGPLALDPDSPETFINTDAANPTSPVLSGTPLFNGVISVLFSAPVAGVGLDGGYFDALESTVIEAYGVNGDILGSVVNSQLGIEFFGLADDSGLNLISGISFYITGPEPAGFAIDNLTFGAANAFEQVPEPSTIVLMGLGLLGLAGMGRKKLFKK